MADSPAGTQQQKATGESAAATGNRRLDSMRTPKKKKSRTGLIVGIVVALALIAGLVAVFSKSGSKDKIAVETTPVSARTIVQTVTATGVIEPQTQVVISPEVSGEIVYLGVQEGDRVTRGQVLVRINPQTVLAERDEVQAQIAGARSRMAQTEAQLFRSEQELARMQQLYEKKLATQAELEAAQSQVKVAQAEVSASRYAVAQTVAASRRVGQSLNKTTITSPIAGVITKLNSKLGEKVVGAIQMTGTEIMTVADLSVIESVVNVSENDVVQVSMGDTAEVEVDAMPGQKFRAVVSRIANSPKQSGAGTQEQVTNFEVRLRFVEPDSRFRPGMTATATIQTEKKTNVPSVPIQSVTTRETKSKEDEEEIDENAARNVQVEKAQKQKEEGPEPIVFVRSGERVFARKVTTGVRDDRFIEITSGLKGGEEVVSGSYKAITKDLKDSSYVSVPEKKKGAGATGAKEDK